MHSLKSLLDSWVFSLYDVPVSSPIFIKACHSREKKCFVGIVEVVMDGKSVLIVLYVQVASSGWKEIL